MINWNYERNPAMKVFSKLFVGVQSSSGKPVPLAFATPYEENAAGRKRQDTVISWLGGAREAVIGDDGRYKLDANDKITYIDRKLDTRLIENEPLPGFRVTDDVKRVYWGGGNVVWRIHDPRGFELEIQSANLMAIIQTAGLEQGGLIPGKCVWGRERGDNILLHESSEEYKDAVKAAETLKAPKQVNKAAREVGTVYRLVDGSPAIYLGKVHMCVTQYPDDHSHGNAVVQVAPPQGDLVTDTVLNWSRYDARPSEPFEAVLPVGPDSDGNVRPTSAIRLYKKAPLVDALSVYECTVDNAFLDSFEWVFASTSITCARITSVTVNPILNPVVRLLPWTPAQYEQVAKTLKDRAAQKHFREYPPALSMILGYNVGNVMCLDDELYGGLSVAGNSYKGDCRLQMYAVPFTLGVGCYTHFSATDADRHVFSPRHSYFGVSHHAKNPLTGVKVKLIPYIADTAAMAAWYDKLWADRALFKIVTREA
jgi:hypothetical protein